VAEADESDASFLYLQPMMAVVTNIDADHMTTYGGDFDRLRGTFIEFLHHLPFYGQAVLCIDDDEIRDLLPQVTRPVITYGFSDDADLQAMEVRQEGLRTHFSIRFAGDEDVLRVTLNMPGRHNVLNALAAIAVARDLGVDNASISAALAKFEGIGRRFQVNDACHTANGEVMLVDDYGHHPREVDATINAIREGWPERRLVLVFQPHRYTRTQEQFDDFAQVLSQADVLVLTEVYAAGETPIAGADGRSLSRAIRARGQVDPVFVDPVTDLPELLKGLVQDGDVVAMMGAGDIGAMAAKMPQLLCVEAGDVD